MQVNLCIQKYSLKSPPQFFPFPLPKSLVLYHIYISDIKRKHHHNPIFVENVFNLESIKSIMTFFCEGPIKVDPILKNIELFECTHTFN
jgi:hypothetical protein